MQEYIQWGHASPDYTVTVNMEILFFYILSNRYHAERAISIITKLFPEDHLLLASSKRVKGKFEILCFEKHLSVEYNSS